MKTARTRYASGYVSSPTPYENPLVGAVGWGVAGLVLYLVGYTVLVIGLALVANLLGVPTPWVVAGVVILVGSGIMTASQRLGSREDRE